MNCEFNVSNNDNDCPNLAKYFVRFDYNIATMVGNHMKYFAYCEHHHELIRNKNYAVISIKSISKAEYLVHKVLEM